MYKIYFADMGKATGVPQMGTRPVVVVKGDKNTVTVYKITSRMREDKRHVRMNNYVIVGFCDISKSYTINKKYLKGFKRYCTTSEFNSIQRRAREYNPAAII